MTSDRMMTKEEYDKKCKALICLHRLSFVVQPGRFHPTSSAVFRIVFPTRRNSFILGPHFSSSRKSTSSRSYYPTTRGAFLQRPFSAECFMTP